jgi:signal transduction histidine kinase
MSLGLAEGLFEKDPDQARRLVAEARATTGAALAELRAVVRGIHPPVLADRGVSGAVQALALDMAMPVTVEYDVAGRPPAPVESAVYFAVAECLANVGKHAGADHAWVDFTHADGVLTVVVGDDGRGGAEPEHGSGMRGVMRRLSAFDGTMSVSSPDRGPTLITLEVPCALSSPKTMPSSGTA